MLEKKISYKVGVKSLVSVAKKNAWENSSVHSDCENSPTSESACGSMTRGR